LGEVKNVSINWKNLGKFQQTKPTPGQTTIAPFKFGPCGTSKYLVKLEERHSDHERRKGGRGGPWIVKLLAKKVVFQFRGVKNKLHHFWAPLKKIWENPLLASPPGKNPSGVHGSDLNIL